MSSLYIPLIFLLVSFIIDKVRENNKTKEDPIRKVKKRKTKVKNTTSKNQQQKENPVTNQQTLTRKSFEKKQRVIVDREKEIFSNSPQTIVIYNHIMVVLDSYNRSTD